MQVLLMQQDTAGPTEKSMQSCGAAQATDSGASMSAAASVASVAERFASVLTAASVAPLGVLAPQALTPKAPVTKKTALSVKNRASATPGQGASYVRIDSERDLAETQRARWARVCRSMIATAVSRWPFARSTRAPSGCRSPLIRGPGRSRPGARNSRIRVTSGAISNALWACRREPTQPKHAEGI